MLKVKVFLCVLLVSGLGVQANTGNDVLSQQQYRDHVSQFHHQLVVKLQKLKLKGSLETWLLDNDSVLTSIEELLITHTLTESQSQRLLLALFNVPHDSAFTVLFNIATNSGIPKKTRLSVIERLSTFHNVSNNVANKLTSQWLVKQIGLEQDVLADKLVQLLSHLLINQISNNQSELRPVVISLINKKHYQQKPYLLDLYALTTKNKSEPWLSELALKQSRYSKHAIRALGLLPLEKKQNTFITLLMNKPQANVKQALFNELAEIPLAEEQAYVLVDEVILSVNSDNRAKGIIALMKQSHLNMKPMLNHILKSESETKNKTLIQQFLSNLN